MKITFNSEKEANSYFTQMAELTNLCPTAPIDEDIYCYSGATCNQCWRDHTDHEIKESTSK